MRVLLTGGTGVIGEGLIPALLGAGHTIRLLSRHADRDVQDWRPEAGPGAAADPVEDRGDARGTATGDSSREPAVEAWPGDVADAASLQGAADACEAVIHVAGIARESPPEQTFERVNVDGTRNIVREASRAGVRRFVFLSSLGADTGQSAYHASKREAETVVAGFGGEWVILRPGAVYGPGDGVVSPLLVLARTLPAMPVIGDGDQRFQPVWYEDLAAGIVTALERPRTVVGNTFDLAGDEVVTLNEMIERIQRLEGRRTPTVPIPEALAELGTRVAEAIPIGDFLERATGLDLPLDRSTFEMLREENFIRDPGGNALTGEFGVTATPLDDGLRRLAELLPERLPDRGSGALQRHRFGVVIRDSEHDPQALMDLFRREFSDLLPLPIVDAPRERLLEPGDTVEFSLQGRGQAAVRVEDAGPRHLTLATLQGHPLAGMVRFATSEEGESVRFGIEIHARAAGLYDLLLMRGAGNAMQRSTWEDVMHRVVQRSGGRAPEGVVEESVDLDPEAADAAERWMRRVVQSRRRREASERAGSG